MQSLERVLAQESCRCVAGVAVVCRSCGVPVSRLHSECTHALCCDEWSGPPHGGGWQADERLYISCLHSKVLCRCVLCVVSCGCGCLAPTRSVTRSSRRLLTHSHAPTQTHTHVHALMSCHRHHQSWLHSCRRLESVVTPLSGSPGTAIMPHTPSSSFSLTTSCCSRSSPLLYSPSGCILVDVASTGDRTTCNHTFKQPHSLLLQRQRFVASIPQFTWWYWLVVSHALVHSLHLLLCSRMNPRDVALYQSFVCLLATAIHLLSLSILNLPLRSFSPLAL